MLKSISILILTLFCGLLVCSKQSANEQQTAARASGSGSRETTSFVASSRSLEALSQLSFMEAYQKAAQVNTSPSDVLAGGVLTVPAAALPERQLSPAENAVAYGFTYPTQETRNKPAILNDDPGFPRRWYRSYIELAGDIQYFEAAFGRLPVSGAELLLYLYPELNSEQGLATFLAKSPPEQLDQIGYRINPATGMLHSSFANQEWEPCGIYAWKPTEESLRTEQPAFAAVFDGQNEDLPAALYFRFYGEQEGAVLLDKHMIYSVEEDSRFFDNPCVVQVPAEDGENPPT